MIISCPQCFGLPDIYLPCCIVLCTEENTAPVAKTAGTIESSLPLDSILLDGSNSTDDQKVEAFLWQQTG